MTKTTEFWFRQVHLRLKDCRWKRTSLEMLNAGIARACREAMEAGKERAQVRAHGITWEYSLADAKPID